MPNLEKQYWELPEPPQPIVYIVPEHFYNMAKQLGWHMSKFEIARGMPDETIINHQKENLMNREPGYYHVRIEKDWYVAKYDAANKDWYLATDGESLTSESEFSEINESRILMPGEMNREEINEQVFKHHDSLHPISPPDNVNIPIATLREWINDIECHDCEAWNNDDPTDEMKQYLPKENNS